MGKWCRSATNFDVLVIGDRLGCPFLEATSMVLSNLLRKIAKGETPHLLFPNPGVIFPEGEG